MNRKSVNWKNPAIDAAITAMANEHNEDGDAMTGEHNETAMMAEQAENRPSYQAPARVLVRQPHGGAILSPVKTREQAVEMVSKNWMRFRNAAQDGMTRGILTETEIAKHGGLARAAATVAYSRLVEEQAKAAMERDRQGRPNTPAARFVREAIAADVGAPAQSKGTGGDGLTVTLSVSPEVATALAERLVALLSKG